MADANDSIRVMHLVNTYQYGGAETVIRDLIVQSDQQQTQYQVCALLNRQEARHWIDQLGVEFVSPCFCHPLDLVRGPGLAALIRRFRPHILHTHLPVSDLYGWGMRQFVGKPALVTTLHNIAGYYYQQDNRLRRCQSRVHRWVMHHWPGTIVAISKAVRQSFSPYLHNWEQLVVIANGIDEQRIEVGHQRSRPSVRTELGLSAEIPVILSVGRLEKQKNYPHLLRAVHLLADHKLDFAALIVGEGSQKVNLQQMINNLSLHKYVRLLGARDDVIDLMNAADCFVMSSLWEGLPMALLEAMMVGLPVVSTAVGAVPEVIQDGVSGRLVPPKDPEALAEALGQVLSDPAMAASWGQQAQRRARTHYSAVVMAAKYQQVYKDLATATPHQFNE